MNTAAEKKHGGKRAGAGRPKGEPTTTIAFRVKLWQVEPVKRLVRKYIESFRSEK